MGEAREKWDWARTIHNLGLGLAEPEDLLTLYLRQGMIKRPRRPKAPSVPGTTSLPGSVIGLGPLPGAGVLRG